MGSSIKTLVLSGIASMLLAMGQSQVWAQTTPPNYRALLVGVSDYPHLKSDLQLRGPRNDTIRMREVLLARGVPAHNIKVLADGVEGAALPNRAAILAALDELARTAKPNDYIVLHLGGHGSQQPVPQGHRYASAEPDGLFEIFLPRDVKGWRNLKGGEEGEVENAILDHEIRERVDRMSAAGAFVWAIFDTCHSATMVRSGGDPEVRMRQVLPQQLGIPASALNRRAVNPAPAATALAAPATQGRAVYFYAAQTHEPTPESPQPAGVPGRVTHGLFSYTLIQALENHVGPMSYEQLGQQILARYSGIMGEPSASPMFSGTALSSGVLGQQTSPHRQWLIRREAGGGMGLPVGQLAEVREGSILALLPTAIAKEQDTLGYVRVSRSSPTSSVLTPVAHGAKPVPSTEDLQRARVARLVQPGIDFALRIGVDLIDCAQPCPFKEPIDAMRRGPGSTNPGVELVWTQPGQGTTDLVLTADGKRLWLLSGGIRPRDLSELSDKQFSHIEATSKASSQGLQVALLSQLRHASRAINLMRVSTGVGTHAASSALQVDMQIAKPDGSQTPLQLGRTLVPGDRVLVNVRNTGRVAVDLSAFYLDSKFGIGIMYPHHGASNRLESQASDSFMIDITDTSFGLERLVMVIVQAERHGERVDLSFLAQDQLQDLQVTRGIPAGGSKDAAALEGGSAVELFRDAGFATHVSRGGASRPPPSATGMQTFTFQVQPSTATGQGR